MNGEFVMLRREDLNLIIRDAASRAASEVAKMIKPEHPELWSAEQIANYLQVSTYTIQNEWSHEKHFPKPLLLGGGLKPRKRWKSDEIIEWSGNQKKPT